MLNRVRGCPGCGRFGCSVARRAHARYGRLGARVFMEDQSLPESKQTAVFFLVLALVAAAGVIYLRWRASDDNRPQGPAPGAVG